MSGTSDLFEIKIYTEKQLFLKLELYKLSYRETWMSKATYLSLLLFFVRILRPVFQLYLSVTPSELVVY